MEKTFKNTTDWAELAKSFADEIARVVCEDNKIEKKNLIAKEYRKSNKIIKKLLEKSNIHI